MLERYIISVLAFILGVISQGALDESRKPKALKDEPREMVWSLSAPDYGAVCLKTTTKEYLVLSRCSNIVTDEGVCLCR